MREELAIAYKNYNEIKLKIELWQQQQGNSNLFPPSDHPISQQKQGNYLRMNENRYKVNGCLSNSLSHIKVWIDGANMVFVEWESSKAQIVIEFSYYGPIVFLSLYGTVPNKIIEAINNCLTMNQLIRLNEEEIDEINRLGIFNSLF